MQDENAAAIVADPAAPADAGTAGVVATATETDIQTLRSEIEQERKRVEIELKRAQGTVQGVQRQNAALEARARAAEEYATRASEEIRQAKMRDLPEDEQQKEEAIYQARTVAARFQSQNAQLLQEKEEWAKTLAARRTAAKFELDDSEVEALLQADDPFTMLEKAHDRKTEKDKNRYEKQIKELSDKLDELTRAVNEPYMVKMPNGTATGDFDPKQFKNSGNVAGFLAAKRAAGKL